MICRAGAGAGPFFTAPTPQHWVQVSTSGEMERNIFFKLIRTFLDTAICHAVPPNNSGVNGNKTELLKTFSFFVKLFYLGSYPIIFSPRTVPTLIIMNDRAHLFDRR